MAKLSVNINKIAVLRNSRGGDLPNVVKAALNCEKFGAEGITVHPRPDERHIRYQDVFDLKKAIKTELNVEGNPQEKFIEVVLKAKPSQVTLVPDAPDAITSNAGWDVIEFKQHLTDIISEFKKVGIRTSIFLDPKPELVKHAAETGTDRIELYTEDYAKNYETNKKGVIEKYILTTQEAVKNGLEVNAGHDLNLDNLQYFNDNIPQLSEVSIGHALISDALYLGLENTIHQYLYRLK